MRCILTLGLKDLRLLWADKMGLFWILGFPLVVALLFGAIFPGSGRGMGRMGIAVIDQDQSTASTAFVQRLKASDALAVRDNLPPDEARDLVRRGKVVAYVILQKGYGQSTNLFGGDASSSSALEVGIDPSHSAEGSYLQGILTEARYRALQDRFSDPAEMRSEIARSRASLEEDSDLAPAQTLILKTFLASLDTFLGSIDPELYAKGPQFNATPIKAVNITRDKETTLSSFAISFPQGILWGLLGCSAGFAISLVSERVQGTFLRLRIAPISRAQILAGKGLACFLACLIVIFLLLGIGRLFFGIPLSNPVALALAAGSASCCFVGLMMFISVLGKTEQSVAGAGWALVVVLAMFGGGMVPLMFMPGWMRTISHVSPVKWAVVALQGAITRDFSLGEMALPCGILLAAGLACFGVGLGILRRTDA